MINVNYPFAPPLGALLLNEATCTALSKLVVTGDEEKYVVQHVVCLIVHNWSTTCTTVSVGL